MLSVPPFVFYDYCHVLDSTVNYYAYLLVLLTYPLLYRMVWYGMVRYGIVLLQYSFGVDVIFWVKLSVLGS